MEQYARHETAAREGIPGGGPGVGRLLSDLIRQSASLVHNEAQLVKAELSEKISQVGAGAGSLAVAAILANAAVIILLGAAVMALANIMQTWLAALTIGLVTALIALAFLAKGRKDLKAHSLVPRASVESLRRDARVLKEARAMSARTETHGGRLDTGSDTAPADAGSGEIAGYVEANRAALDRTLTELEERISPQAIFDVAVDHLRHGGGAQYVRGLKDAVVRNPLPVTLTAVSLAWTMLADRHPAADGAARPRKGMQGMKDEAKNTLAEGMSEVHARSRHLFEQGRSSVHSATSRASAWGSAAAEHSRESVARAEAFSREHPLIVAGAGLTLGAVIAALLPATRTEDEHLGPARDAALRKAKDTLAGVSERLADTAGEGVQAAAYDEGSDGGLDEADPSDLHAPNGMDQGPGAEADEVRPPAGGR